MAARFAKPVGLVGIAALLVAVLLLTPGWDQAGRRAQDACRHEQRAAADGDGALSAHCAALLRRTAQGRVLLMLGAGLLVLGGVMQKRAKG